METVIDWLLNDLGMVWLLDDYGLISHYLTDFVLFVFTLLYGSIVYLTVRLVENRFPRAAATLSIAGVIGFFTLVIIAILGTPKPLEIAKKYATPAQKAKLHECLKREYETVDKFYNQSMEMFVSSAVYNCEEKEREDLYYKKNKKNIENLHETMQKSISELVE